jgi:molybdopterin-guanine dinucleotide biosynthesis protein A
LTETTSLTGLILAGGASRRMGENKALLALEGRKLIERVADALAALTDDILIIANEAEPYRFLDRPIIPDIRPGYGPLMGLYSGLKAARGELALLVAVDMPFLSPDYLRFLLALAPGYDVVIPRTGHRLHPLCAVYRRESCLPAIEQAIARGQRRLIAFHPQMRVRQVDEAELRRIDPDLRALMNVNTPEELEAARRLLKG